jgi:hypothetical protein
MKDNIIVHLEQALRNMPNDHHAYHEIKLHINQAIRKLADVEKRKAKKKESKKTQQELWQERMRGGLSNPLSAQQTLDVISDMLAREESILKELEGKKNKNNQMPDETLLG